MNDITTNKDGNLEIPDIEARRLRWLLIITSILFVFGIFMPMITITRFIIAKNSFSLISGAFELLRNGQILLFIVVTGFSIVLPVMKITILFKLLSKGINENPKLKRYLHLMHEYGRWAMLDVMVVAVLVVTVRLGL